MAMNETRFLQMGWVLAAALVAVMAASGFQEPAQKSGVVDIARIVEGSEFGKQNQASFAAMKKSREEVLEFLDTYRILTAEQAQRIRDLSLKPNATAEEKAELERIKAEVVATSRRSTELSTKPNLTAEERTLIEEYARRSQTMAEVTQRWLREFTNEMQTWADNQKVQSVARARKAIQDVAKAQGYTLVFEVGVAPYGANDLSDDALKAMNEQK